MIIGEETDPQRIARLECTCDALKFHLEALCKQVATLELMLANSTNCPIEREDINCLIADTAQTFHTIETLHDCRKKQ